MGGVGGIPQRQRFCGSKPLRARLPGECARYCLDKGFWRTLKTQPLSTRRYPSEPSLSGSSPDDPRSALDPLTWRRWLNLLESGYNRRRWIGHQSSKRVHDGEPDFNSQSSRYLIDFITGLSDVSFGIEKGLLGFAAPNSRLAGWSSSPRTPSKPCSELNRRRKAGL